MPGDALMNASTSLWTMPIPSPLLAEMTAWSSIASRAFFQSWNVVSRLKLTMSATPFGHV